MILIVVRYQLGSRGLGNIWVAKMLIHNRSELSGNGITVKSEAY